jgi:hypothetical protein
MAVNGGLSSTPTATTIAADNPNGGQPVFPPPAKAPAALSDNVVTTNPNGAFAHGARPHA